MKMRMLKRFFEQLSERLTVGKRCPHRFDWERIGSVLGKWSTESIFSEAVRTPLPHFECVRSFVSVEGIECVGMRRFNRRMRRSMSDVSVNAMRKECARDGP